MTTTRPKKYNIATHILTTGREYISKHLEYIFNSICHHHAPDLINSINLNPDTPKYFGSSMGSAKAMSFNIVKHFAHAINQSKECPQYSVRGLLILEFINTCLHETKHLILKSEPGITDDSDTEYQEAEAEKFETLHRWDTAQYINVEVTSFGPVIDDMMAIFYKELTEAREAGTMDDWQEQQLYMIDNGIIFHDTRKSVLLKSVFDFFHYFSKTKEGWDRSLIPVFEEINEFEETTDTNVDTPPNEIEIDEDLYSKDKDMDDIWKQEDLTKPLQPLPTIETGPAIIPEGYDPLMDMEMGENEYIPEEEIDIDTGGEHDMSTLDSEMDSPVSQGEMEAPPVQPMAERAISSEAAAVANISKIVMHRLFNHIYSKCGWNGVGKFTNPNAVLDPVNINDIEGASELFTRADAFDADGKYKVGIPTDGFLRGITSNDGIPMYKLYVTFKGITQKRTFIPQNPDKTNNGQPTAWAKRVMAGHRLAMLLPESGSPKLYLETTPGQLLGQEKLTMCNWNTK